MMRRLLLCPLLLLLASSGCKKDEEPQDLGVEPDQLPLDQKIADEPFGRACELGKECSKDPEGHQLFCVGVAGSTQGKGFCTRQCTDIGDECFGVPNGQSAACILKDSGGPDGGPGKQFCAFLCKNKSNVWTCPATLHCGPASGDSSMCVP